MSTGSKDDDRKRPDKLNLSHLTPEQIAAQVMDKKSPSSERKRKAKTPQK